MLQIKFIKYKLKLTFQVEVNYFLNFKPILNNIIIYFTKSAAIIGPVMTHIYGRSPYPVQQSVLWKCSISRHQLPMHIAGTPVKRERIDYFRLKGSNQWCHFYRKIGIFFLHKSETFTSKILIYCFKIRIFAKVFLS